MKIKMMISQHRRDFWADMECEGCGHVERKVRGYDDDNFHEKVIPGWQCTQCGKSREDLGIKTRPTRTKYEPWEIV